MSPITELIVGAKAYGWGAAVDGPNTYVTVTGSGVNFDFSSNGLTLDSSNNVYLSASVNSTGFLTKFDSDLNLQWQRSLSGESITRGGPAVDGSGNVYVSGYTSESTLQYGTVAKYNSSGSLQWQRRARYSYGHAWTSVACDTSGNVYAAGSSFKGSGASGKIIKYNTSGTLQWENVIGAGDSNHSTQQIFYNNSNSLLYYIGYTFVSAWSYDMQVINSSGTRTNAFAYRNTDVNRSYGYGITSDSSGNIYAIGSLNADTNNDWGLIKLNSSGTMQFQKKISVIGSPEKITLDPSGNIYICGYDSTTGGGVIMKFNNSGTLLWQRYIKFLNASTTVYDIKATNDFFYLVCNDDGTGFSFFKIKSDGTGTGTYTRNGRTFTYSNLSLSVTTPTYSGGSGGGYQSTSGDTGTSSMTGSTPTYTAQRAKW